MLLLNLDRNSSIPLYRQVVDEISKKIESHILQPGDKMPSTRALAKSLGLHRSTVYRAYEELWSLGYIQGAPGSYTFVRQRGQRVTEAPTPAKSAASIWQEHSNPASRDVHHVFTHLKPEVVKLPISTSSTPVINFSSLNMDRRLIPTQTFRRALNGVLREKGDTVLRYCDYAGYKPLREFIAHRLSTHGITASADEILITNGSQNAIDLILRLLVHHDRPVILESPTYSLIFPLLNLHGVPVRTVPMTPDGMDLDVLTDLLAREPTSLVYTMPNFQNPTGITTDQAHRERLLELCQHHNVPLVEDGFEEEMKYFGNVTLPIKSMDINGLVIYVGTFSKVLMPGLRIGWVAASVDCIERLTAIKRFTDLSTSFLTQAALHAYCQQDQYELHIRRMHRTFRKRMNSALVAMETHLNHPLVEYTTPKGGYLAWVRLKELDLPWETVNAEFHRWGIVVSPGEFYFWGEAPDICFRLSFATLDEQEISAGMIRLGEAINTLYGACSE